MSKQFDINKLNSFIETANNTLSCNSDCQKQKTADELKNSYEKAKSNLYLAEPEYQHARKNYYEFVSGKNAYDEMMEKEYNDMSDLFINEFKLINKNEIEKIKSLINSYDGLYINFRNIFDLYNQYKIENEKLLKNIKNNKNNILTNDRKTYYEEQENNNLNYYYYIFFTIYIIVVLCFIIFSIIYPTQTSIKIKIIYILIFIILPFISTWILEKIIYFIYLLFNFFPKNVYK